MKLLMFAAVVLGVAACGPQAGAGTDDDGAPATAAEAPAGPAVTAQAGGAGLKVGEYACYGSGSTVLAGLGFKVTGPGQYTDLDNLNAGRFTVSGTNVTFSGGHLDGQTGRDLKDGAFTIGALARCEPWA